MSFLFPIPLQIGSLQLGFYLVPIIDHSLSHFFFFLLLFLFCTEHFTVRLTLNSINFKTNDFFKISRFCSFAYENIMNLIVPRFIKITELFFRIINLLSVLARTISIRSTAINSQINSLITIS